jgi:catechol 2,3-dioxygenase-like lactoylglutathione lyase family enzyme
MDAAQFRQVHPIVGTRDLDRAIAFYVERLGFELAFDDDKRPRNYVGLRRDGVVLHFQFQYEHEMGTVRLRFRVRDPDALLAEYESRQAFALAAESTSAQNTSPARVELTEPIRDTPWGSREFGFYDPDGNALFFYRPLE